MKNPDIRRYLKSTDWKSIKRTGYYLYEKNIMDINNEPRIIQIAPEVNKKFIKYYQFINVVFLSFVDFNEACKAVADFDDHHIVNIEDSNQSVHRLSLETGLTQDFLQQKIDESIDIAMRLDLDKIVDAHAKMPFRGVGLSPIIHLTALAMQRNVERLQYYADNFEVYAKKCPWLTYEHIQNALAYAKTHTLREYKAKEIPDNAEIDVTLFMNQHFPLINGEPLYDNYFLE